MYISKKNRNILAGSIALVVLISSLLFFTSQAGAAPVAWDRYTSVSGINEDIYTDESSTMSSYNDGYTLVPDDGDIPHGVGNAYTNLTIDETENVMSKWYVSGYGPYLNYAANSSDPEGISIDFNRDNNTFSSSNYAYVASMDKDFADAKSVAAQHYTDTDLKPILINSSYSSLSNSVVNTLQNNYVKNVIVVGGEGRMDNMFGIGGSFNLLRIGGEDRNRTYEYLEEIEVNADEFYNIPDMPELNNDGYVMKINSGDFLLKDLIKIEDALQNFEFEKAAEIVLSLEHGEESNISSVSPAVVIGCREDAASLKAKFFISYFLSGTGEGEYGVYQYIGEDYIYDNGSPGGDDGDVQAIINAPDEVEAGEEIELDGSQSVSWIEKGETEEGEPIYERVDDYFWSFSYQDRAMGASNREGRNYNVWFSWPGSEYTQEVTLRAVTESGKSGTDREEIKITAPIPKPVIEITGHTKENRKFTVDASQSSGNAHYPITKYSWEITGEDNDSVFYEGDLENGNLVTNDIQIGKPGDYTVSLTVENSVGLTGTTNQNITIRPDEYPTADVKFIPMIIRDPSDDNYATFEIRHTGGSPDDDIIDKRIWAVAYDSNNDGSYDDEIYKVYSDGAWKDFGSYSKLKNLSHEEIAAINDGNQSTVKYRTDQVGKYDFQLIVQERFGQPTIEKFLIYPDDLRISNSFDR